MRSLSFKRAKAMVTAWGSKISATGTMVAGKLGLGGWTGMVIPKAIGVGLMVTAGAMLATPLIFGTPLLEAFIVATAILGMAWVWMLGVPQMWIEMEALWAWGMSSWQSKTIDEWASAKA